MQLIKSSSTLEYRYLELNQISRELKILAKDLNILIVATSELNRNLESRYNKRPELIDLRDSGTIEDDADKVIFIYRDDIYKAKTEALKEYEAREKGEDYRTKFINKPIEDVEFIIAKQNNGSTGTVKLKFEKMNTKFFEDEKDLELIEIVFDDNDTVKKTDIPDIL